MHDYNPNSSDAVLARILERLDAQDVSAGERRTEFLKVLGEIHEEVKKTNGRVTRIELWRAEVKAKTAQLAMLVSAAASIIAWIVERLMH